MIFCGGLSASVANTWQTIGTLPKEICPCTDIYQRAYSQSDVNGGVYVAPQGLLQVRESTANVPCSVTLTYFTN